MKPAVRGTSLPEILQMETRPRGKPITAPARRRTIEIRGVVRFVRRRLPPFQPTKSKVQSVDQRMRQGCGVGSRQLRRCSRKRSGQLCAVPVGLPGGNDSF
jgi:hypothetical protein